MAENMKCPECGSHKTVEGKISVGGDGGWNGTFNPDGLRFLTFRRSVPLVSARKFRACTACGMVWGRVQAPDLKDLIGHSGTEELRKMVFSNSPPDTDAQERQST